MDMTNTPVLKLLLKLSPPVMLALLIQSIYNIVDSFFIARYSAEGLTALSIIYPIQLLMTALATGTGAGVNLLISRMDGQGEKTTQSTIIKSGLILAIFHFFIFLIVGNVFASIYFHISSANEIVCAEGILYTRIVCSGALGLFVESICTKILQARGNMIIPMVAQITGALTNMILDPVLIWGFKLGISGAAIATVMGQWIAMLITFIAIICSCSIHGKWNIQACIQVYKNGIGSIVTQSLYTIYIIGLNMILKLFAENAVTVLGIYYKIQSFFFIPLLGFQQVLLPVISYNFGAKQMLRIRQIIRSALLISCGLMMIAMLIFMFFPQALLSIFSVQEEILEIGTYALRVIALSFIPSGITIVVTSHLQGITKMKASVFIIVLRQVFLLVPLAWLLHFSGLKAVWWTFPLTELLSSVACFVFEKKYA